MADGYGEPAHCVSIARRDGLEFLHVVWVAGVFFGFAGGLFVWEVEAMNTETNASGDALAGQVERPVMRCCLTLPVRLTGVLGRCGRSVKLYICGAHKMLARR